MDQIKNVQTIESNKYIPRSLDITEIQLLKLIKKTIKKRVLPDEFIYIYMLVNCFAHTTRHIGFCEGRMTEFALRQLYLVYQYT